MSGQQISFKLRRAYWEAFEHKCAYCGEAIARMLAMEIDHVIPERLANRQEEFKAVLQQHDLPETFDIAGRLNLVASCKRCNSRKGADRNPAVVGFGLKEASQRAATVDRILKAHIDDAKLQSALSCVREAVDSGRLTNDYVSDFLPDVRPPAPPQLLSDAEEILRVFGNASTGLLNWPQKTDGKWLERPELDLLLDQFERPHSFTVLLGEPGSGKSALLARVAEELSNSGVTLLALKADLLPPEVCTLGSLDEFIGTQVPIADGLRDLATSRPVVFLIDQLDAISDLMVQRTSRLSVLLGLINRLREIENLHILCSCRSFEFEHDLRLATLKPESVSLVDPPFSAVEALLDSAGISCAAWPNEAKEILRRPQHLNLFLRHLSREGPPCFRSYHAMIESVYRERLLKPYGGSTVRALETIAAVMAEEENLWLPVSRFELEFGQEIQRLVAADILRYGANALRIGFRHQTIFDFVRARAFASGNLRLAQHVLERQDSLFIRPILWATLHYLRDANRTEYRKELQLLWESPELRHHVRLLLVEFLGRVSEPDAVEIEMIRPRLLDLRLRGHVITCIRANPCWFPHLLGEMPTLMKDDEGAASWLLRAALTFDRDTVVSLIERCWHPDNRHDPITLYTLGDLKDWDERTIRIAEISIRRTPGQSVWEHQLWESVAQSRPELTPRLVAATLWGLRAQAEAEPDPIPSPPPATAPESEHWMHSLRHHDAAYAAIKRIIEDSSLWYGISKIAMAAPRAFVEQIWPWILDVATKHAMHRRAECRCYRDDYLFSDAHRLRAEDLISGIDAAITGFAREEPDHFLRFARENEKLDLGSVHCWLAKGYSQLGSSYPNDCAGYILRDTRRLSLGGRENRHKVTIDLISAFVEHVGIDVLNAVEESIRVFVYYTRVSDDDARTRFQKMKWNRERRLRLLRALPRGKLSRAGAKYLAEEERALPNTPDHNDEPNEVQKIVSVLSSEKMAFASKRDLIRLLDELHDGTGWNHPRDFMRGGVVETSRAFGDFAKQNPKKALGLLKDLKAGMHEYYASAAIQGLGESDHAEPGEIVKMIHNLSANGFTSEEFRYGASSAFSKLAARLQGLDDASCALLEGWLEDWPGEPQRQRHDEDNERKADDLRSILWDWRGGILPRGNFPPLRALFRGYMHRNPPEIDRWLAVIERHLRRREDPEVWIALAYHELRFLGSADHERASRVLESVLAQSPVLSSGSVVRLVAQLHSWLPPSLTRSCLEQWQGASWRRGPQAAAEVAMLRHAMVPDDTYCAEIVEDVISGRVVNAVHLLAMRVGVTRAAAEIWNFPRARVEATRVLLAILPCGNEPMVQAWRSVFDDPWTMADDCTREILDAVCRNREIIRAPHARGLVERLKDLLERSLEPERVSAVAKAILDECGSAIGDFRSNWVMAAGGLIDIALTLQRFPGLSINGLHIFERLMEGRAYKVEDVLRQLDRKW